MEELPILRDIALIFGFSIGVLFLCHRLGIPSVIGFLLTGIITGPQGLGLVSAVEQVDVLAKIGLILLLFTIGMEFAPVRILRMWRSFFIGGGLQVGISILGGLLTALAIGRNLNEAIFLGCILSLSSTAIVMKLIHDWGESRTHHGKLTIAILIFQDVIVVPMILVVPFLAGEGDFDLRDLLWAIVEGGIIVGMAVVFSLRVIPPLLESVARTRSRELFLLTLLTVCFTVTWFSVIAGLSLSLGAFLAGVMLSESDYRHQAIGNILPFRDIFTNFFFISMGMLLNLDFFFDHALLILSLTGAVILLKGFAAGVSSLVVGSSLRTSFKVGLSLSQVGEFGFVIAMAGRDAGIGEPYLYQIFLSVLLISMLLTPILMRISPWVANWVSKVPILLEERKGFEEELETSTEGHVIIAGYGSAGRYLARACQEQGLPYQVLESNPDIVRDEKGKGVPISYGEASNIRVLEKVNIAHADTIAILISEREEEKRVVEMCRKMNPNAFILVRTRSLEDKKTLCLIGADEVIVENYEIGKMFIQHVLSRYEVSPEIIDETLVLIKEPLN